MNFHASLALLALGSALAAPIGAHGGIVPAPPDTPPVAPNPGGSGGTGPKDPSGGSGTPGAPGTPNAPGTPGTPGAPSQPPTGTLGDQDGNELTQWSYWWELNRHPYLNLKAHVHAPGVLSGSDDFFLGYGASDSNRADSLRPAEAQIRDIVVPALLHTLETARNNDLVRRCLVALAKIGDADGTPRERSFRVVIQPFVAHPVQEIAETATVCLGILGNEDSAKALVELMDDEAAGRRAVGRAEVPYRQRAFAAYGLGVLGARSVREDVRSYALHHLVRALEGDDTSSADLPTACILGIGLLPLARIVHDAPEGDGTAPPSASRSAAIAYLLDFAENDRNDYRVRAHAITSAGRLLEGLTEKLYGDVKIQAVERLLRLASRPREPREVSESCVLTLGGIGDADLDPLDARIRKLLAEAGASLSDQQARNFALLSLGRCAGRPGRGSDPTAGRKAAHAYLQEVLERGKSVQRPWAGLGIGLLAREIAISGEVVPSEIVAPLRKALGEEKSPVELAAYAIASGLAVDAPSGAIALKRLRAADEDRARGYLVLALGMMDYREASETLQGILRDSRYRPELLEQAAVALALLAHKQAVPELIGVLQDAKALSSQAALAFALGLIGDSRSIESLVALLQDETVTESARSFAAAGLGYAADKDPLPWNSRIAEGLNYHAVVVTLYDERQRGVLDIL